MQLEGGAGTHVLLMAAQDHQVAAQTLTAGLAAFPVQLVFTEVVTLVLELHPVRGAGRAVLHCQSGEIVSWRRIRRQ